MKRFILLVLSAFILTAATLLPVIVLSGQSNAAKAYPYISISGYEIIKCAKGGSSVTDWQRGQPLYDACLEKVAGRSVAGIFHYQGERDSYDPVVYSQWSALTSQFFNHFREDTNSVGVRVVYAQLGTPPADRDRPYWRNIQSQQAQLLETDPTLRMIRTYTIVPYCPAQGPHFCAAGYQVIADKFESAFLGP